MEQPKPNNSDQNPPEKDSGAATSGGGGRSYGCTFCKRGFTNAQALGGHMNIHRKDNPKSKGKMKNINHDNLTRFPRVDLSGHGCDPVFGGHVDYEAYFASSNRWIRTRNYFPVEYCRKDPIGVCPPVENGEDVDLELRLGQYP